jgi:peptidylprolyl isomerase
VSAQTPVSRRVPTSSRSKLLAAGVLPLTLLIGSLAGCADAPTPAASGTTSSGASASSDTELAKVTVTPGKDAKTAPTITLPTKPFRVKETKSRILKAGTGAPITDPGIVTANWARFSGVDGSTMGSSYGGQPAAVQIAKDSATVPGFVDALKDQKVGVQALLAIPANKILNESQLTQGMTLDDTVLFVLDTLSVQPLLDKATGTAVPPKAGLPTVQVPDDPKQPAKFTVPSPTPVKETVVQPLITGAGPKVGKGQTILVRYTGATWRTPDQPFDYSGKSAKTTAEFPIGAGQLIKAWDNNIPGQTVGSRLLIIAQPADGYGANGNPDAQIKGDDVLIFVMDILGAWTP